MSIPSAGSPNNSSSPVSSLSQLSNTSRRFSYFFHQFIRLPRRLTLKRSHVSTGAMLLYYVLPSVYYSFGLMCLVPTWCCHSTWNSSLHPLESPQIVQLGRANLVTEWEAQIIYHTWCMLYTERCPFAIALRWSNGSLVYFPA